MCHLADSVRMAYAGIVAHARNSKVPKSTEQALYFPGDASPKCPLFSPGGPSPAPLHPKRSPTSTGEAELKEERLPGRKASCSAAGSGSRGLPPSSPMVSSAHNPNKAEIPERRKDSTSTPVSGRAGGGCGGRAEPQPHMAQPADATRFASFRPRNFPCCSWTTTQDSLLHPCINSLGRQL